MKIKKIVLLLAFCFSNLLVLAQEKKMNSAEIQSFKQSVNAVSKKIQTLTADFVQYKHLDFLSKDIETAGKIYFSTPNLLKWQYNKPYNYSIIFKNNKVLIDNEGKKSAIDIGNSKVFAKINKLIVGSVSGDMFDEKEFSIDFVKTKNSSITRLTPKDASLKKYIKQIELTFDKTDNMVVQIKLIESSDDYTRILLKNKTLNVKIDPSVFTN